MLLGKYLTAFFFCAIRLRWFLLSFIIYKI